MTIGIIGIGLIGGSLAVGLRQSGFAKHLIGVENSPHHAAQALEMGLIDEVLPLEEAARRCEVLIAATPVDALIKLLPQILDLVNDRQVILDVGSTKLPVLQAVAEHPKRSRFVATHPMAGTEYSGPAAAVPYLFAGKCCVFCDVRNSASDAVELARKLYDSLGMRLTELDGEDHDLHAAYVSHISHIASFALALTVLEKEKEEARIFELASGGFSSTVRLAKSNPETWTPIFRQNRDNVLDVLDEFINTISRFRTMLIKKDFDTFHHMIEKANDIRRIIG
jgi:prephenate dehydrogenase